MNKRSQGGSPQAFLVVLLASSASWGITVALLAGMWAAIAVAFALTNMTYILVREYRDGIYSTARNRTRALIAGIGVASFALLVWALPIAIEFSNTKP